MVVGPTEIGKNLNLILDAQKDMTENDVLVCGRCLYVFHFVDAFLEHKKTACVLDVSKAYMREYIEDKATVWGYLLWKASKFQQTEAESATSPTNDKDKNKDLEHNNNNNNKNIKKGKDKDKSKDTDHDNDDTNAKEDNKNSSENNSSTEKGTTDLSSKADWNTYLEWTKLDSNTRDTWIVAGKTILSFNKIGQSTVSEMPVKITKTVVNNAANLEAAGKRVLTPTRLAQAQAQLRATMNKTSSVYKGQLPKSNTQNDGDDENVSPAATATTNNATPSTATGGSSKISSPAEGIILPKYGRKVVPSATAATNAGKTKTIVKSPSATATSSGGGERKLDSSSVGGANKTTATATPTCTLGKRTVQNADSVEIVEEHIERIVAKRFNSKRRLYEYFVKWANRPLTENTWEPYSHLEKCPHFLDIFEKQLLRQKEVRAAMAAKQAADEHRQSPADKASESAKGTKSTVGLTPSGRPARSSKIKAMDNFKQWTTDTTDDDAMSSPRHATNTTIVGSKRKLEDLDFLNDTANNESALMEDLEESLIPTHTVKRTKNGSVESKINQNGTSSMALAATPVGGDRANLSGGLKSLLSRSKSSADVIVFNERHPSGIVKKPNYVPSKAKIGSGSATVRILTKEEAMAIPSGIFRVSSENGSAIQHALSPQGSPVEIKTPGGARVQRVVPKQGTPANVSARPQAIQRPPLSTTIQRKVGGSPASTGTTITRGGPAGGTLRAGVGSQGSRMLAPRPVGSNINASTTPRTTAKQANVTPEQKILQLSKSGDLKVTKKLMTRDEAERMQRQQGAGRRVAPSSGASAGVSVSVRKHGQAQPAPATSGDDSQQQHTLCPITGKLLGPEEVLQQEQQQQQQQQQHVQLLAAAAVAQQQQQQQQELQEQHAVDPTTLLLGGAEHLLSNEDGSPILVTSEDGTVYQVAGKNAEGQTILVTQGPDGEQQYAYVAASEGDDAQALTLENAVAEAVARLPVEEQEAALAAAAAAEGQILVKTTQEDGTTQMVAMTEAELAQHGMTVVTTAEGTTSVEAAPHVRGGVAGSGAAAVVAAQQQGEVVEGGGTAGGGIEADQPLCIQTGGPDGQEANIPAEVVQAELPSPGGTRRVVLLLQDGTFMMTEMSDTEFKSLNINVPTA